MPLGQAQGALQWIGKDIYKNIKRYAIYDIIYIDKTFHVYSIVDIFLLYLFCHQVLPVIINTDPMYCSWVMFKQESILLMY